MLTLSKFILSNINILNICIQLNSFKHIYLMNGSIIIANSIQSFERGKIIFPKLNK